MKKNEKKPEAEKVTGIDLTDTADQQVIVVRATRPLTQNEHEQVKAKLESEETASRVKIILLPHAVEYMGYVGDEKAVKAGESEQLAKSTTDSKTGEGTKEGE